MVSSSGLCGSLEIRRILAKSYLNINIPVKIGIQTKCYSGTAGDSAIQESVAGMNYYHFERAMVITNSRFTQAAIELANANNIILWDRIILREKIESYKIENMVR